MQQGHQDAGAGAADGVTQGDGATTDIDPVPIERKLGQAGQDLSGEVLVFSPEWSANLNAQYILPIGDNMELSLRRM